MAKVSHKKIWAEYAKPWFEQKGWKAFAFQQEVNEKLQSGQDGLLNAPTGSGKTYALFIPILLKWINLHPAFRQKKNNGLIALWITPVRALARDLQIAMQHACDEIGLPWEVALRTGDTTGKDRAKQRRRLPEVLITTPESLHLLLAQKEYPKLFNNLQTLVVDEWHELLGTKRGVQVELALSRIRALQKDKMNTWGISATIGNLTEAAYVLFGINAGNYSIIRANVNKKLKIDTLLPDEIDTFPWAGHMGIVLLPKALKIIDKGGSTLIFTNTRNQAEVWYQKLLEAQPDLAGQIAMHHGSISSEIRGWIEDALHQGKLKVVVCTSSLDLGVDFRPVDTVIQIGSPKGVARFMQRAGRSGHQPGATSVIHLMPTNSLELLEASAIKTAVKQGKIESRVPVIRAFDVLIQYLITLAVSEGFKADEIFAEIKQTYCYESVTADEWNWVLGFITTGGSTLEAYAEFKKVVIEDGIYKVTDKRTAMRHRLSIGTIVSDASLSIKFMNGGRIGSVEEYFVSRLKPGDVFTFAGKVLEMVLVREMAVYVRISKKPKGIIPSWMGGRMPLSSELSEFIRVRLDDAINNRDMDAELNKLAPLFEKQRNRSHIPAHNEFLVEQYKSREGYHLFMYPFEGRLANEGLAMLVALRLTRIQSLTFSIAMNDYGFELLSDQEIPLWDALEQDLFTTDNLQADLLASLNASEMARRKFREIASIAGLVFKGFPGKKIGGKHLQASSKLFFEVFTEHEPNHLLLKQAYEEVLYFQLEENRLRKALLRIRKQEIIIKELRKPSPFCFPILVDRLRNRLTTEQLEARIERMLK